MEIFIIIYIKYILGINFENKYFLFINIFFIISINIFAFNDFNSAFHKPTVVVFRSHKESLIKLRGKKKNRRELFLKVKGYISTLGGDIY